jgi:hypothetical protein
MSNDNNHPVGKEQMETKLWEYIDGQVGHDERKDIEKLIAENAQWKATYSELVQVHESLNLVELEQPSMRFTRNVMEEIARLQIAPATKKYIDNKIVWGIGIFFLTMIAGILIYGFAQIDWAAGSDSSSALGIDLNKVDYSKLFNSSLMNVFMMLNVVLGLFLLDRYLSNKMKKTAGQ